MTATDRVDLEIRAAAHVGPDIAVEMATDKADARAAEFSPARCLAVEIGVAAVGVELEAEADEDPAARAGAGILARLQAGSGGRNGRADESADQQPRPNPQCGYVICHFVHPSKGQTFAHPHHPSIVRALATSQRRSTRGAAALEFPQSNKRKKSCLVTIAE